MNRISIKGVVIGSLTDMASFYLNGIPIGLFMVMNGHPINQPLASGTLFFLHGLCSMLGGYVAGQIARRDEALNGALSSIISVGFCVYPVLSGSATGHYLINGLLQLPIYPVLAALGGCLSLRTRAPQF
jgi:putative membrane protein (TIGR04086 family)